MKKKGFTLIELLAVIVILAIIAVIATPIITGIIEDSKKASFERSVEGIIKGTELDVALKIDEKGYEYEIEDGVIENLDEKINISNTKGYNGIIRYDEKANVSYAIHNDKWCIVNEDGVTNTFEYKNNNCKISTNISAFIYNSVEPVGTVVKGDNCVSYLVDELDRYEENAIEDCNNNQVALVFESGKTLEELNSLDVVRTAEISFETGENCENYIISSFLNINNEEATTLCNGGTSGGLTLKDVILMNTSYSEIFGQDLGFDIETLQTNNVIKNVVIKDNYI